MNENEIATIVINSAIHIHRELGPGLFESVYEKILEFELRNEKGLYVSTQVPIPVFWKKNKLDIGFRADMIIEDKVIVEIKSIEQIAPVHPKQVLTYLKLTSKKLGLLINFNEELLRSGVKRIVNNL
ncbi:MAG: GxxExxY protein [Dinghuibacter sp.]|nr:GxxExxY protein [Dinghuibacter sp.]